MNSLFKNYMDAKTLFMERERLLWEQAVTKDFSVSFENHAICITHKETEESFYVCVDNKCCKILCGKKVFIVPDEFDLLHEYLLGDKTIQALFVALLEASPERENIKQAVDVLFKSFIKDLCNIWTKDIVDVVIQYDNIRCLGVIILRQGKPEITGTIDFIKTRVTFPHFAFYYNPTHKLSVITETLIQHWVDPENSWFLVFRDLCTLDEAGLLGYKKVLLDFSYGNYCKITRPNSHFIETLSLNSNFVSRLNKLLI